jgi:hypothetical protein
VLGEIACPRARARASGAARDDATMSRSANTKNDVAISPAVRRQPRAVPISLGLAVALTAGCDDPEARGLGDGIEDADDRAGLHPGENGNACVASPYNCKLRVSGGNRVATNDPDDDDSWAVHQGVAVLDGNGDTLVISTKDRAKFNYWQRRSFGGEDHVFAMSTSNSSAGWMPLSSVLGHASLAQKMGHVSAKGAGLDELGCYEVRSSHDPVLAAKKVVYDTTSSNERAGDYLPLQRANGQRSVNLVFNVPGFALGGPAIDHFPAGTKFQRLDVPTDAGAPSIDIPLWVQDSKGRYRKQSGTMKFVYGYVIAATGTKRNGWMAHDALKVSSGCGGDDAPPPLPPAGDAQCYARCCNQVLQGPVGVSDAAACHEASQTMCAADDHVLRSELDGVQVWQRESQCWAKCENRDAYHALDGVTEGCTQQAATWCDVGDRGGLEDAAWSRCEP